MKSTEAVNYENMTTEELFEAYAKDHKREIKWEIALRYTDLVKNIALQIRGVYCSFTQLDDIINEGLIVLSDAVDKYDPSRGRFDMYVAKRIRGMIVDIARRQDWVPRTVRQRAQRIEKVRAEIFNSTGQFPSDIELAEQLDMNIRDYQEAMANISLHSILSLEELFDGYSQWPANPGASDSSDLPEQSLQKGELLAKLTESVSSLRENEQTVLSLYYEHNLKMKDIASFLGISAPRVSQIHARAVQKLRVMMEQYLDDR